MSLQRGVNGTTPAPHVAGAAVIFVETNKTRFHSLRSTIRNGVVMSVRGAGRGFAQYQTSELLPLPPVSIQDAVVQMVGGTPVSGQAITWVGWQPDLEVNGLRFTHLDVVASAPVQGTAISWTWDYGAAHASRLPFPAPQIRGGDNQVRVTGILASPDASYSAVQRAHGDELIDLTVTADVSLRAPGT